MLKKMKNTSPVKKNQDGKGKGRTDMRKQGGVAKTPISIQKELPASKCYTLSYKRFF